MFDFAKAEIFEPMGATKTHKYIEEFATKISAEIVEKQNELILTTIQIIGGDEFIDITIDKDKVIEALTDYVNKQKGVPNIEVRHGEWHYCKNGGFKCTACGGWTDDYYGASPKHMSYCPKCGAKMDGERRDT